MKNENDTVTNVSVQVTHLLTTQGKTFIDGELIKLVLVVGKEDHPGFFQCTAEL